MALQIDPSMYSGGAVALDSQPVVNMYAKLMERKQAKDEAKNAAIDEYIRGLSSKITPTGTRTADMPEFNDKFNKWQEFVTQNKKNMGDINTQMQANALYQQALAVPVWSKGITEREKDVVDILKDPNKSTKLRNDPKTGHPVLFGQMHKNKQSRNIKDPATGEWVANPDYGEFDLTADIYKKENIDEGKLQEEVSKGMTADAKPDLAHPIDDKGYTFYNTTAKFSQNQVSEQAKKTKNKIYSDEELMDYYQKEFDKTSKSAIAELNTYYKKYVDPDGEILDPAQYGAAKMAKLQEEHEIKTGTVSKRDLDKAFQQSLIKISYNKGGGLDDGDISKFDVLGGYSGKEKTETVIPHAPWGGTKETVRFIPATEVSVQDKAIIGVRPIYDKKRGEYYRVIDDYTWEGEDGQKIDRVKVAEEKRRRTPLADKKKGPLGLNSPTPKPQKDSLGIRD